LEKNHDKIKVDFLDGTIREVEKGANLGELSKEFTHLFASPIVAAKVNNNFRGLDYNLKNDCTISFLDLASEEGIRTYTRSLSFVLVKAARELFPQGKINIEHSLSKGIYGEIHFADNRVCSGQEIKAIEEKMKEIIAQKIPLTKQSFPRDEAIEIFKRDKQSEKIKLLGQMNRDTVSVYGCGDTYDYFYGHLVPDTGYLTKFALDFYPPGFILKFPQKGNPGVIPPFIEQKKLFTIYHESETWQKIMEVNSVADLNDATVERRCGDLIRVAEAFHEKKIAQIADLIASNKEEMRLILISGPSSSGKTTFAQRLCIQLRINGLKPVSISLDDYFVNREFTPKDENGEFDFEALEAIDVPLFNQQLMQLISGEEVDLPTFNFKTGCREYSGRKLRIDKDQPIIIEGIHGLNNQLTASIPKENKFKIYISALTQISIDDHNRIPTTDTRLIRRIVRDSQFRSHNALDTLRIWPSVRRGEEKNIFPYQEEADVMFNSALVYELAVLKKYAEPLLLQIDSSQSEYGEARRLIKFLSYFWPIQDAQIPLNSIIREFIGGSCFH